MGNSESRGANPSLQDKLRIYQKEWTRSIVALEEAKTELREAEARVLTLSNQNNRLHEELLEAQKLVRKSLSQVERYRKRAREYLEENDDLLKELKEHEKEWLRLEKNQKNDNQKNHKKNRKKKSEEKSKEKPENKKKKHRKHSHKSEVPVVLLNGTMGPIPPELPAEINKVEIGDEDWNEISGESDGEVDQVVYGFQPEDDEEAEYEEEYEEKSDDEEAESSSTSQQQQLNHSGANSVSTESETELISVRPAVNNLVTVNHTATELVKQI